MSSDFGKNIRITIFGQSHSEAIGAVIDGLPAGEEISIEKITGADIPRILSGLVNRKTCGAPLCALIENTDVKSSDYANIIDVPRPSHADYPAYIKHHGANDVRGGGHFSGRLTAPLCFAGAVCSELLERRGISIGAHIYSIGNVSDSPFDPVLTDSMLLSEIKAKDFPVIDKKSGEQMRELIETAAKNSDSVGGIIECCALGLDPGIGEPMFDGLENRISSAIFGIPAVKGIEFGSGFSGTYLFGSENNDSYYYENGVVKTKTNRSGGILGGLSNGMPLVFRAAIKPTPSIGREQSSVSLSKGTNESLVINGRHDPCIVPRAVPCVEAVCAAVLLDMIL